MAENAVFVEGRTLAIHRCANGCRLDIHLVFHDNPYLAFQGMWKGAKSCVIRGFASYSESGWLVENSPAVEAM